MLNKLPIWPVIATAVGYWLLGLSAGFFAIPPGYASPIWPASGFAFLMILKFGNWTALGIFIASFLLNLRFSGASLWQFSDAWILALMIAAGAASQSLLARFLTLRLTKYPKLTTQANDTLLVGLIGGPLACITSASIGVGSLWLNGVLPPTELTINWINWWIGDSIGVLIFCPVIIATCLGINWSDDSKLSSFFAIYIVLIVVASALFVQVRSTEEQKVEAIFQQKTQGIHLSIEKQLQNVFQSSNALAAFIATYPEVSFSQFRKFSSIAFQQSLGAHAQSWIPVVPNTSRHAFEEALSNYHNTPMRFYELNNAGARIDANTREIYYPVYYIEPLATNLDAVGFDLGSNPERLKAIDSARKALGPIATAPIILVQENEEQHAFLLLNPVLTQDNELLGFVSSVYRASDIIDAALDGLQGRDIEVTIKDVTLTGVERLFYKNKLQGSGFEKTNIIEFAGRRWVINYQATKTFSKFYQSINAWIVLVAGFFVVTIFGLFILLLMGRSAIVENEVKHKTKALNEALQKAQAASEIKTAFLANMSHELRTPLNSIIGFSTRILKTKSAELNPRISDSIKIVQRNGQHLLALINDILDISKIEAGKVEVHKEHCNINELVEQAVNVLRPNADEKSITLSRNTAPVDMLMIDHQRILQVLINLLSNAIKYTDSGSVSVHFSQEIKFGRNGLNIHISDTGKGIPASEIGRLFKRFEQLGNTFTPGEMSTGLGLSLTRELVVLHDGEISVESKANIGSTFTVWLPTSS